jgi:hypothetical protein
MSRPTLEVADIVRRTGNSFWEQQQSHLAWPHRKVLDAIVRCRTAALGGHRDQCVRCGHQAISFNSCRNRHCPKCQGNARAKWLAARSAELLPVPYFHVVFTLPHSLSALALQNKRLLYDLLYRTSAATMLELARDPKHLGADIGFLGVLHTWGQNLRASSSRPLHRSRRGPGSRRIQMDRFLEPILPACPRTKPSLPRQVRRWTEATRRRGHASVPRLATASGLARLLSDFLRQLPTGLGGLRQATLRRRRACSQLPGPLHPSRGHLQPSSRGF